MKQEMMELRGTLQKGMERLKDDMARGDEARLKQDVEQTQGVITREIDTMDRTIDSAEKM